MLAEILHMEVLTLPANLKCVFHVPYHSKLTPEPLNSEQRWINITGKLAFKLWL